MELFLLWFGFAIVTGIVAGSRDRNAFGWFLLAVVISPLLALILVALIPSLKPVAPLHLPTDFAVPIGDGKPCPRCAETVKRAARVCRFCGHEFTEPTPSLPEVLFDRDVFVTKIKPTFSKQFVYEAYVHGTRRDFTTEAEAVEHIRRWRQGRLIGPM